MSFIKHGRVPKTVSANNAAATITTETAKNNQSVFIVSISASFTTALTAGALLTVTDGTTTLGQWIVHSERDFEPCMPIKITPDTAAVISLAASGSAGNIGYVTATYYIG